MFFFFEDSGDQKILIKRTSHRVQKNESQRETQALKLYNALFLTTRDATAFTATAHIFLKFTVTLQALLPKCDN